MFKFLRDRKKWDEIRENPEYKILRDMLFEKYEEYCKDKEIPSLPFSKWIRYAKDGDRYEFEKPYFIRRHQLTVFAMLCLIYPEKEEYLSKLQDVIWAICEEHSWCLPAHIPADRLNEEITIDLFASETALYLAEIKYTLFDRLSAIVTRKISKEIKRRITDSIKNNHFFFETVKSNWSAVCGGSVAVTLFYEEPDTFVLLKDRLMENFDRYRESIIEDGAISEGVSYWEYGYGFYMLFADMYERFTMGRYDLMDDEKIKKAAHFHLDMCLDKTKAYAFADGNAELKNNLYHTYYLREKFLLPALPLENAFINFSKFSWAVRAFLLFDPKAETYTLNEGRAYYEKFQCFTERRKNYSFAIKGGHNGEEHNHNDIGSFVLCADDRVLLCDLGAPQYSRFTLSVENYDKVLEKSSKGHTVPLVNGETQGWGKEYTGKLSVDGDAVTVDMKNAYKKKPDKLIRKITLHDDEITLCDSFSGCTLKERFVTEIKPEISKGLIKIEELSITFSKEYEVSVEHQRVKPHSPVKRESEERDVYLIDVDIPEKEADVKFEMKILK